MNADVDRQERALLDAMQAGDRHVTPDKRIGLDDAAWLVGWSVGHMQNVISRGDGPHTYRIGGHGHRRTVKLRDLAEWMELRRDEDPY